MPLDDKDKAEALAALKRQSLFYGLDEEGYENVVAICTIKHQKQNDVLFKEGEASYGFFILLGGDVALSTQKDGIVHHAKVGEIFGEMGAFAQIKRTATATMEIEGLIMQISHLQLSKIMEQYPKLGYKVMANVCKLLINRLVKMSEIIYT